MMNDQAQVLRGLMKRQNSAETKCAMTSTVSPSRTIAITSGKGGVGKTHIALNLAIGLAQAGARVCVVDANFGLGNIDLLCGLDAYWNISHVVTGARQLEEIVLIGPAGIHVVPGATALTQLDDYTPNEQQSLEQLFASLQQQHDYVILDTAAGLHRDIRCLLSLAHVTLVVTTPEATAIADAYATIKSLGAHLETDVKILVNQVHSPRQADEITKRLVRTAKTFSNSVVRPAGAIPYDEHVFQAVEARTPFTIAYPNCAASLSITDLAHRIHTTSIDCALSEAISLDY